jgi:peptidoglycan-associated lipoprotein
MKQPVLVAAISVLAIGIVACGGNKPPAAQPTRPAAPATPPPAPPPSAPRDIAQQQDDYARLKGTAADEIDRMGLLADVHYDFDSAAIREADRAVLAKNAEVLKKFDFLKVTVEGHCDERGTVEYNLALGERRSKASYDYLVSLGVPAERLKTVSYGKEVPVCQESSEDCWARNRRAKFTVTGKTAAR